MKSNFYLLIIFFLAFTFGNAQSTAQTVAIENNDLISAQPVETLDTIEGKSDAELINASEIQEAIARSSSDIKLYFNRIRNVDNLNLLFPKINKAEKA